MDRKKELKELYKQMKHEMGILRFFCEPTGQVFLGWAKDTRSFKNKWLMQLNTNGHPNKTLQAAWNAHGETKFTVDVIDTLEYDKDESKTDYTEELKLLLEDWLQKTEGAEAISLR